MNNEIETTIYTEEGVRISVDEWDDGGVWLSIRNNGASIYATMTRADAEQILAGLQKILNKEVTA
jgi:hypothetical protein